MPVAIRPGGRGWSVAGQAASRARSTSSIRARRQRPDGRVDHRRERGPLPGGPPRRGPLLRLPQALRVARQGGVAAAVAPRLELAEQAPAVAPAGVPPLQEERLPGVEQPPPGVAAPLALAARRVPQVADHRAPAEAEVPGDRVTGPAL